MRLHNLTRRGFFRTTAAAGAAAAAVQVLAGCSHPAEETVPSDPVVVEEDSATTVLGEDGAYEYLEREFESKGEWELPLGNVLHEGEGTWLPVTTAGASAMPMVKCSAFSLSTGELTEVVAEPITPNSPNVVIYDARCSDSAYAWVELDTLTKNWSLYAASFANGTLSGSPNTLWQGDAEWDPPLFAVTGNMVIWQVMPAITGTKTREHSFCYVWHQGDRDAKAVVESPGRFAAPPAVSEGTVTLAPRVRADEGVFYGITAYSLRDDLATMVDQLVLPQSVRPFRAVRMGDLFAFSIEANYSSGGLLGRMGTYLGTGDGPFTTLVREPSAQVAGKNGVYIIKSRASYFVIDVNRETYSILVATNRCVDYGEYPASEGTCSNFVTFATVKDAQTGYPSAVTVRSFAL